MKLNENDFILKFFKLKKSKENTSCLMVDGLIRREVLFQLVNHYWLQFENDF